MTAIQFQEHKYIRSKREENKNGMRLNQLLIFESTFIYFTRYLFPEVAFLATKLDIESQNLFTQINPFCNTFSSSLRTMKTINR